MPWRIPADPSFSGCPGSGTSLKGMAPSTHGSRPVRMVVGMKRSLPSCPAIHRCSVRVARVLEGTLTYLCKGIMRKPAPCTARQWPRLSSGPCLASKPPLEPAPAPGFENFLLNDVLCGAPWEVLLDWRWKKDSHINRHESDSTNRLLQFLVTQEGDLRFFAITNSAFALGAHRKARFLRASLRRAGALACAGGLYPGNVFGPSRLNTSDDPTRDRVVRSPCPLRVHDRLNEVVLAAAASLRSLPRFLAPLCLLACCVGLF